MTPDWPSHDGRRVPVHQMANRHLDQALGKLRTQEDRLIRLIAGLDPAGAREFRKALAPWTPAFTFQELLGRTRDWIVILENEKESRNRLKWPEIFPPQDW